MAYALRRTPQTQISSMRNTGRSALPFTVPTSMRPTDGGDAPNSANTAAAESTHTGSPRKMRQFPLSAKPVQRTVRVPAVSVHSKRFCLIFRWRYSARIHASAAQTNIPAPANTSATGARST